MLNRQVFPAVILSDRSDICLSVDPSVYQVFDYLLGIRVSCVESGTGMCASMKGGLIVEKIYLPKINVLCEVTQKSLIE